VFESLRTKFLPVEFQFISLSPDTPEEVANSHKPKLLRGWGQLGSEDLGEK
jgi:hypothetical protein